ncbi:MAG: preprotein translocase subunit YajC [Methylocystaceae bacterium]|jgi:preprotein translocase subunit YajC|nr:preprotein translocase subunit YajC [Methylocystaceae bacterium]
MKLVPDAMAQTQQSATPAQPPAAQSAGTLAPGAAPDAMAPQPSLPDLFAQLVPIFVVMGIVYILVIRPRARREKEQLAQLRNVRRGDTLVTSGGLVGKVTKSIDDDEVEIEIAPNVRVRLLRSAITEVRAKGEPVKDTPAAPKA